MVKEAQTLKRADPEALADASLRLDLTEGALGCASRPERGKPREMAPQLPGLRQATALWAPDVVVVVLWGGGGATSGCGGAGRLLLLLLLPLSLLPGPACPFRTPLHAPPSHRPSSRVNLKAP